MLGEINRLVLENVYLFVNRLTALILINMFILVQFQYLNMNYYISITHTLIIMQDYC